jgi:hypothetical protein
MFRACFVKRHSWEESVSLNVCFRPKADTRPPDIPQDVRMMRTPSRFMPKFVRKPTPWWSWVAIGGLSAGYGYLVWSYPLPVLAFTLALALAGGVDNYRYKRRLRSLAHARTGESICTFARELDLGDVDTWVVRAVYEQLQNALAFAVPGFPIRWSDRLREDLGVDGEDLDLELAIEIAQRTGRSLKSTKDNPYYDKVRTVGDLVMFFNLQPQGSGTAVTAFDPKRTFREKA